jgi:hypothetical protein
MAPVQSLLTARSWWWKVLEMAIEEGSSDFWEERAHAAKSKWLLCKSLLALECRPRPICAMTSVFW